jgi:hypothetical protein
MIDTGASSLMFFESRFRGHFPDLRPTGYRELENMEGVARLKEVHLPELKAGTTSLEPRSALLIPAAAHSTPDFDGLLGLRSLGARRVYFDFNKQLMSWAGAGFSRRAQVRTPAPARFSLRRLFEAFSRKFPGFPEGLDFVRMIASRRKWEEDRRCLDLDGAGNVNPVESGHAVV